MLSSDAGMAGQGRVRRTAKLPECLILGCTAEPKRSARMAAALDALASAYDAKRHGSRSDAHALCVSRLKEGRRHAATREFARSLREA